jgi:hypothetical protein
VLCATTWCLFPVILWILGYVCQCLCLSFAGYLLIMYIWYFSSVFKCFPFLCVLMMSIVSVMFHVCVLYLICGLNILSCCYYI